MQPICNRLCVRASARACITREGPTIFLIGRFSESCCHMVACRNVMCDDVRPLQRPATQDRQREDDVDGVHLAGTYVLREIQVSPQILVTAIDGLFAVTRHDTEPLNGGTRLKFYRTSSRDRTIIPQSSDCIVACSVRWCRRPCRATSRCLPALSRC